MSLKQGDRETHLQICLTVPAAPLVCNPRVLGDCDRLVTKERGFDCFG